MSAQKGEAKGDRRGQSEHASVRSSSPAEGSSLGHTGRSSVPLDGARVTAGSTGLGSTENVSSAAAIHTAPRIPRPLISTQSPVPLGRMGRVAAAAAVVMVEEEEGREYTRCLINVVLVLDQMGMVIKEGFPCVAVMVVVEEAEIVYDIVSRVRWWGGGGLETRGGFSCDVRFTFLPRFVRSRTGDGTTVLERNTASPNMRHG
ncbi:hypothetical protein E2C01_025611 [Portunus trituberculatus]|uniref:Uncharacterized protein n=1 Tax=Portunus trituberculatus TaxID=210409 RepID=A0A5B7EDR5_PORTR|nr:hypothetical protein [Portunus trituberculatus]